MVYNVGDKIVYPMHGAGVIEAIEEKEILGKIQNYYVVKIPIGDMKVLIPTKNVTEIGIREIITQEEVEKVLTLLEEDVPESNNNWTKRYRENMIKIKSGNIFEVTNVVKSLIVREKEKGLSTGERKMLNSAKQILLSELILVKDINQSEAENYMNQHLNVKS